MSVSHEFGALTRAFSGLGVDEKSLISILGKWGHDQKHSFRKGTRDFFIEDERQFEKWDDRRIIQLGHEFLRIKNALVYWTMHPWERDARLVREAIFKRQQGYSVLIEIACARSSEELLGARRAYHSLYDHSIEEDVASHVNGIELKLLVALVSSYRYEGPRVNEEIAKSEAKILCDAIQDVGRKNPLEDDEVVRILTTRSKLFLATVFKHYKEITGKHIDEDLEVELHLRDTVQCLCTPHVYFSKVLGTSLQEGVDENAKEAVTRVIVTRADVDMKQIKEEFHQQFEVSLSKTIEDVANGNYRDFLLTLIARGD